MLEDTRNIEELTDFAYNSLAPIAGELQVARTKYSEIIISRLNDGRAHQRTLLEIDRLEEDLFRATLLAMSEYGQSAVDGAIGRILDEKIYVPSHGWRDDFFIRSLIDSENLVNGLDAQILAVLETVKGQNKDAKLRELQKFVDRVLRTTSCAAMRVALEAISLHDKEITGEDVDGLIWVSKLL